MILDWCLAERKHLEPSYTREAFASTCEMLEQHPLAGDVHPLQVHAVAGSSLLENVVVDGGARRLKNGLVVPRLADILAPKPAEYARLLSKGRLLYEHCMTDVSHSCVVGFMHHELRRSLEARRVVLDLLGWMLEQRMAMSALIPSEGDGARRRAGEIDAMLDLGVSFLHGLDRETAERLAGRRCEVD